MTSFKPTTVSTFPAIIEPSSESAKFWKNNVHPATVYKELNAINSIDINCFNEIITTSSSKVSLYDPLASQKKRTFLSPNHTLLYGGTFRTQNPKIFATGSADGIVRIWDCKKSKPLILCGSNNNPQSQKHSGSVHRVNFNGFNQLFSCGDDKDIKLWNFTENTVVSKFGGDNSAHEDYIRASCFVEKASLFVSGSYDHKVKIWDYRSPENSCFKYNHKHPVESVTYRDLLVISASGNTIQVFDIVAGKCLQILENIHHKTITCIHNHARYLLTASIDGHLKIYDLNFNVAASFSYCPSQLLSCNYNGTYLAVGSNDGILSINKVFKSKSSKKNQIQTIKSRSDEEDISTELFFSNIPKDKKDKLDLKDSFVVQNVSLKPKNEKHEILLRRFKYSSALSSVMKKSSEKDPEKVVNFMQELIRRNGLKPALAGRTITDLKRLIQFLISNLSDLRYTRILLDVSLAFVEVYGKQMRMSPKLKPLFKELNDCVNKEINCLQKMSEISGQLKFLINSQIK